MHRQTGPEIRFGLILRSGSTRYELKERSFGESNNLGRDQLQIKGISQDLTRGQQLQKEHYHFHLLQTSLPLVLFAQMGLHL